MRKSSPFALVCLIAFAAGTVQAQNEPFPVKTIRVVVPFAPGGSADLNARMIAPKMSELLGQSIVVDNRAGASGNIGSELVARAAPDGYTLLLNSLPFVVNPLILGRAPYHPVNDFSPVSILSSSPSIVAVHPSVPVHNIQGLLALARAKPGALNYASAGVGTNPHVAGELFNQLGKVNLVPVHFKGGGPGLIAAMSGEVGVTFTNSAETSGFVRAKKLRALAITSIKRASALPEIPTVAESGLPTYEFMTWFVLAAPAKTPRGVVAHLNDSLRKTLATPEITRMFTDRALDIIANAPDAAADYLKRENERWARLVKERGLKGE